MVPSIGTQTSNPFDAPPCVSTGTPRTRRMEEMSLMYRKDQAPRKICRLNRECPTTGGYRPTAYQDVAHVLGSFQVFEFF